jgi:hypothetical protein
MKLRNGFVSNSSSSSFVAIGFNLEIGEFHENELLELIGWDVRSEFNNQTEFTDIREYVEEYWYDKIDDSINDNGINIEKTNNKYIVSHEIAHNSTDDGYLDDTEFYLNEANPYYVAIENIKNKIAPNSKLIIFTGTKEC